MLLKSMETSLTETLPEASKFTPGQVTAKIEATIIDLKMINPKLSLRQLAKLTGIGHESVRKVLIRHDLNTQKDQSYKDIRADIFASKQRLIIAKKLDVDTIEKMNDKDSQNWFGILYDKERLERGQSTENIAATLQINVVEEGGKTTKTLGLSVKTADKQGDKCKAITVESVPSKEKDTVKHD